MLAHSVHMIALIWVGLLRPDLFCFPCLHIDEVYVLIPPSLYPVFNLTRSRENLTCKLEVV
jgi:hypothetical protein